MGAFLVSFHARADDRAAIRDLLAETTERAWVGPGVNGWVSFYDERADTQDAGRITELCEQASRAIHGPVIAFLVHDSDFLCYWLFESGNPRDEYNSCPDYFGDVSEMLGPGESPDAYCARVRGDADALLPLCPSGVDRPALEAVLRVGPEEYVFAEHRLAELARMLGINPDRATTAYRDVGLEYAPDEFDLEFVGTGTPPQAGEDSWDRMFGDEGRGEAFNADHPVHLDALIPLAEDPNQKLALALLAKDAASIRAAIAAGADVNREAGTALTMAVGTRSEEMVRLLLEHGADAAATSEALDMAISTGSERIDRLLLEHGADPRCADSLGWTPLHRAAALRNPSLVRLLLQVGADPAARNAHGETAADSVDIAIRQTQEMADRLKAAGGSAFPFAEEVLPELRAVLEILREADR